MMNPIKIEYASNILRNEMENEFITNPDNGVHHIPCGEHTIILSKKDIINNLKNGKHYEICWVNKHGIITIKEITQ